MQAKLKKRMTGTMRLRKGMYTKYFTLIGIVKRILRYEVEEKAALQEELSLLRLRFMDGLGP